jgi:type VI secretion system secreted protein VgrG
MATVGYTQTGRALRIDTPLGPDVLLLRNFSGQESVSQLFRFQLELLSEDDAISFDDIVGKKVTVHIQTLDSERGISGFISRFSQGSRDERFTYYRAEMVPWLWFLTRTADCRIFQRKTAPDIIKKIFSDLGFSDFELRLLGAFRTREYCVQYRETDFNFVSRLMEEEGICYFFEHSDDGSKHTLVLGNDDTSHKPCPNQPKARCDLAAGVWRGEDLISEWRLEEEYRPSAWAHTDYNFETPSTSLMVTVKDDGKYEIYDYPGFYIKKADGDHLAKTRLQETVSFKNRATGKSNCRNFTAGSTVEVTDHYRKDVNRKWMLTAVHHQCSMGESYGTGGGGEGFFYTNTFECVPSSIPFRPPRLTPKPNVQGCQTAVVVGPGGEEIYTDKYGRVKVQFHWDREGKKNEDSSCWIRVSYPWAGKNWGGIHIPRIGQEVIVDFLEGDPDQPLIIGRVYHAESMPPWGLPAKKVVSGLKSNSTKGGGGYNEFSMDDTKGNELINVHAQFDQQNRVEHDERTSIGHDRTEDVGNNETITIGNNRTEKVGNNEKITIVSNRTENVGLNETITIGSNRTENVGANESVIVDLNRTHTIGVNDALTIGATQEITVGAVQALTVGAARSHTVGAAETISVGADQSIEVGANQSTDVGASQSTNVGTDQSLSVGASRSSSIGKDDTLEVGKSLTISAGDEIVLTTGTASITMKKDGTITIKGKDITVNGSGAIEVKASKDITMKGQKILQN